MIDRLRAWWRRPLADDERRRLFIFAAAGLVALAGVLVVQQATAPERAARPAPAPLAPLARPSPPAGGGDPGRSGPSDEGSARYVPTQAEVAGVKRAARRFLTGYLPYTYGRSRATRIRSIDLALREELARQPPRVPPTVARLRPRVGAVQTEAVGGERASALAFVRDGRRRYTVTLGLERVEGEWLVTDVAG